MSPGDENAMGTYHFKQRLVHSVWMGDPGADPGYVKRGGRDPKWGRVADITRK